MPIQSLNPATGEVVKTFDAHTDEYVDRAIARAVEAHKALIFWTFDERAVALRKAAKILEEEASALGEIMTLEMGKTHKASIAEVEKCAWVCRYYAETAAAHLADEPVQTNASEAYRKYLPLGPVLAVMPWNYPLWQVFRFAAPALMAGNTGLLKHASNVPQSALAIEDVFKRAGFPDGAFQTLLIGGDKVERILRDDRVRAATLTGSEPAGASVASICGEEIKPTVLELGGSDAFIIMPSADIEKAVATGMKARTQNNGQSCIAAKRFFVHADIYDDVKARFKSAMEDLVIGDPMSDDTDIGPLVNQDALDEICKQVDQAITDGADRVTGAEPIAGEGYFYRPGILENIPESSDIYHEEFFAPVMMLFKVDSLKEAVDIANSSPFGLGSSIWTMDKTEQDYAIAHLEAGGTFVNSMTSSDPRLPFGGIKKSGYGRELAAEGIRAFCNVKTVSIA